MSSFDLVIDIEKLTGITDDIQRKIEWRLIVAIRQWLNILLQELKKITPERSREMLNSYKIWDVTKVWDTYIGSIGNTAKHSIYVEFGVNGRVYKYHKPQWSVFYTGVGNKTFQRALVSSQDKIYKLIQQAIRW